MKTTYTLLALIAGIGATLAFAATGPGTSPTCAAKCCEANACCEGGKCEPGKCKTDACKSDKCADAGVTAGATASCCAKPAKPAASCCAK